MKIKWDKVFIQDRNINTKKETLVEFDYFISTIKKMKQAIVDNDLELFYNLWENHYNDFVVCELIDYIERGNYE